MPGSRQVQEFCQGQIVGSIHGYGIMAAPLKGNISIFEIQKELGHHDTSVCITIKQRSVIVQLPKGFTI
jgi:hypothetical protein